MLINGLTSKMWVERYDKAGECKFVAPANADMRNKLPIGSFVSHVDTTEIMIIENHEINDQADADPVLTITGRGFETFFENRIVGSNKTFPTTGEPTDYVIPGDLLGNQIVLLIADHILAINLVDDNDAIPFTEVINLIGGIGAGVDISVKRGPLYDAVLELLGVGGYGIKVIRPGPWSPLGAGSPNVAVAIHNGVNRTGQIIFSHDTGEIESADYLWSIKKNKNTAMVSGRWVETLVTTAETGYNRRMIYVDASDIDNQYEVAPTGADLTAIINAMQQRGATALANLNDVAITKAEVAKTATKAIYRRDFDVGDLITVSGDYNETSSMQVTEYVEIEDENGRSGYPTLSAA